MKHITYSAALCLVLSSAAFAQQTPPSSDQQPPAPIVRSPEAPEGGRRHAPNPHRQALMLSHRLNLTPDQTARLEPILADREQKIAALRANTSLTPDDMRQQMRAIHEQERTQLASVLTPDQQQQLKSMHRGGRRGHGLNQPHGEPQATPGV